MTHTVAIKIENTSNWAYEDVSVETDAHEKLILKPGQWCQIHDPSLLAGLKVELVYTEGHEGEPKMFKMSTDDGENLGQAIPVITGKNNRYVLFDSGIPSERGLKLKPKEKPNEDAQEGTGSDD